MRQSILVALVIISAGSTIFGCGKKKSTGNDEKGGEATPAVEPVDPGPADPCAASAFVLKVGAEIANRDQPESFQLPELTMVDGAAIRLQDGAAYTLFIADYPIDRASFGTTSLHPPAGKVLITAMITSEPKPDQVATPVAAGQVISTSADESGRVFELILERGADQYHLSREATGQLEVLRVDDHQICVAIDYSDAEKKSVSGLVRLDAVTL